MTTIAINMTLLEFIVLPTVALIFGLALYLFMKSRKNLHETLEATKRYQPLPLKKEKVITENRSPLAALEEQILRRRAEASKERNEPEVIPVKKQTPRTDEHMVTDLKQTIAHQQRMLDKYLDTIEDLETRGKEELKQKNKELEEEIIKLQQVVDKKDAEIEELFQEAKAARKMAARIEEVYQEFDQLQFKMQQLEKQAGKANNLAIELEDVKNEYEVIHKDLARKQEKLEAVMEDNRNLKDQVNLLEDKLSEANLQRQQLQKKVQFLTDMNNDMQDISEANKKLQTELRRIGELESMLNMMAEERDYLLKKKER